MSHFAEIDANGIVLQVLKGDDSFTNEGYDWFVENLGGTWVKTSYNNKIRGTFAGEGFSYNPTEDIFIEPQPYPSWNRTGSFWHAPTPYPTDGKLYSWDEPTLTWKAE